jgi:hypothetical protein
MPLLLEPQMLDELQTAATEDSIHFIRQNSVAPPVAIPPGHVGPVVIPGTGRMIWWTGRVAIGLRHQPERHFDAVTQSALWVQDLMLRHRSAARAA